MPMVWYVPPLSPVVDVVKDTGHDAEEMGNLFGAIDALRIPVEYLAGLFTAGDIEPVTVSCASSPRCGPTCATSTSAATPDASIPAPSGWAGGDVRDVPSPRDRQIQRALRHPHRARRAGHRLEEIGMAPTAPSPPTTTVATAPPNPFGVGSGPEVRIAVEDLRDSLGPHEGRRA